MLFCYQGKESKVHYLTLKEKLNSNWSAGAGIHSNCTMARGEPELKTPLKFTDIEQALNNSH